MPKPPFPRPPKLPSVPLALEWAHESVRERPKPLEGLIAPEA